MEKRLQDMTQEEIRQEINNKLDEFQKDSYYITSVNSIGEITECVDSTVTDIEYTIAFKKIQKKKPKQILDKKEKEWLENFLRPFKDRVTYISLRTQVNVLGTFIEIGIKNDDCIGLPSFDRNKYYKGMELDKEYTLKELKLFE